VEWLQPTPAGVTATKDSARAYLEKRDAKFGFPKGTSERLWQTESSSNFYPPISPKGAIGPLQLMPDTAKQYGANPWDPSQNFNAGTEYLSDLTKRYRGDLAEALAAYNWGPGNVDAAIRQHGKDWLAYAPTETQNYVMKQGGRANGVDVNIYNNTGGSAVVTASGLAH
jgi:soluble lytic murein transglycosylase-like protein